MSQEPDCIQSSGNIFSDLGLDDAEDELAKAQLARSIRRLIQEMGVTQTEAAQRMGTDQAKVSALMKGRIAGFTLDRLVRYLNALQCDVQIIVSGPHIHRERGKVLVRTA